jgi:hypothetical protein
MVPHLFNETAYSVFSILCRQTNSLVVTPDARRGSGRDLILATGPQSVWETRDVLFGAPR